MASRVFVQPMRHIMTLNRMTLLRNNFYIQPRFNFIARAPQGLSEMQEEKKVLLPFTTANLWNNVGARTTYKQVGRGPGSGLG